MRRRRWARAATVLSCLAIAIVLQLAVAEGRSAPSLLPPRRAHGDGHAHARPRTHSGSGLPPSPTGATTTVHHAVAAAAGVGASVRFDAAVRCKSGGRKAARASGVAAAGGACAEDDDDKRRIPTGPNPLHNR
jgi:hypothetical protein